MPPRRDDYCRHHQHCIDLARGAVTAENGALWIAAAKGWRFLIDREDRLAAEAKDDHVRQLALGRPID
jgi:hypothetical protein